jgi:hypothetical protein
LSVDGSPPSAREGGVVVFVGVALAVVMFWPLVLHLDRDVPKDLGDSLLSAYLIGWNGHAFLHQPFEWWQTNAFWPNPDSLAFSDAFIGYTPVALLGTGFRAAIWHYNVLFLSAYALSFAGAYLLARELGLGRPAAAVAGVAFAYSPWRWEQSAHVHVLASGGIPLCLMLLLRGYRGESPAAVVAGWLVAAWQVSIGVSLAIQLPYLLAILAAVGAVIWWRAGHPAPSRRMVLATAAGLTALAVVCVVVARPYLRVADEYPESRRTLGHVEHFSPPPRAFVSAPADNLVWGEITAGAREGLRAVSEQTLFPGALVLALAVFGLLSGGWPRRLRIGLAVAALAAAIFSMGLAFLDGKLTYRLLFDYAPGWDGSRTPGRLHTLTTLFLALLAAAGAQAFISPGGPLRTRARPWLAPAVCLMFVLVILLEGSAFRRIDGALAGPAHPTVPPPPQGLRQAQAPLIHLPADDAFTSVDDPFTYRYMVWSTEGFPELVNGISGFIPQRTYTLAELARGFPDRRSVEALRAEGIRTVVLHPGLAERTVWDGAASQPVEGLGITRRVAGDVVLFDLRPRVRAHP